MGLKLCYIEVVDGDSLNFYWNNELVADVPASTPTCFGWRCTSI